MQPASSGGIMYLSISRKFLNLGSFTDSGYIRLFLWVTPEEMRKCHHIPEGKVLIFWVGPMWNVTLGESKIMIFTPFKIKLRSWVTLTIISLYCYYHLFLLVPTLCTSQRCCLHWWWDAEGAGLSFTALGAEVLGGRFYRNKPVAFYQSCSCF